MEQVAIQNSYLIKNSTAGSMSALHSGGLSPYKSTKHIAQQSTPVRSSLLTPQFPTLFQNRVPRSRKIYRCSKKKWAGDPAQCSLLYQLYLSSLHFTAAEHADEVRPCRQRLAFNDEVEGACLGGPIVKRLQFAAQRV